MPRAQGHIADGFQPGAAQAAGDGIVGSQRGHRQRLDRIGFLAMTDDFPGDIARHRARADRCTCNPCTDDKALPRQRAAHHLHQRGLATEQMGAAGDVEKQAMRGIERHQWRKAIAPVCDVIQRLGVGSFIGIEHLQLRTDGAGIGQRQADLKAETRGQVIQRGNLQRVVLFGDDNAGNIVLFSWRGAAARERALDAVGGQARQPQAEDTPPVFRKDTHHISIP